MEKLLFLTNEFMNPEFIKKLRLPMSFIAFGITDGKLYKHFRNQSTFLINKYTDKTWGNSVVYGGLFVCKDFDYYAAILDAHHICSLTSMFKNHVCDLHHRVLVDVTIIHFNTLEDLERLKYREGETVKAQTYVGNLKHPKITSRFNKTISYRILDGIDAINFKKLFEGVSYGSGKIVT